MAETERILKSRCRSCRRLYEGKKCKRCHDKGLEPKYKSGRRCYDFNTVFVGENRIPVSDARYHGSNYE